MKVAAGLRVTISALINYVIIKLVKCPLLVKNAQQQQQQKKRKELKEVVQFVEVEHQKVLPEFGMKNHISICFNI